MKNEIKIEKFSDDDTATIFVNGRDVGYVERLKDERFVSASLRGRVSFVSGYTVTFWDLRVVDDGTTLETRAEIRAFVAKVVAEHPDLAASK